MATPTIIIGLGSSGYHIIKETQKFYFGNFGKNKPSHVEYLYVETFTGEKNIVPDTNLGIKKVYTSLAGIELMVKEIKEYNKGSKDWLPPNEQLVDAGAGAGGVRPCGRLALWGRNTEGDNFRNIVNAINQAHAQVRNFTQEGDLDTQPVVFVVGTLVGGTASGMFIDIGYLVRHLIKNVRFIFGLFLLPPIPISMRGEEYKYANAYGALKELREYNDTNNKYLETLPSRARVEYLNGPFDYTQLISQDYENGSPALEEIGGLVKMAGLFTFLNIAGMYDKRRERLVDGRANANIYNYGTFGLSAIQYPKGQIEEYIACKLSEKLLNKWLETTMANGKPINVGTIESKVEKKWGEIIQQAFNKLDIVGDEDLIKTIENESRKINSKKINESEYDHIKKIFSSNQTNQLYAKVKGNVTEAVNFIIDEIYNLNVETFDTFENITYAQKVLEAIIKSIKKTIQFWKKQEMASDVQSWENFLRNQCTWMLNNLNKVVFEQNNTLNDRMLSTFSFMKMHLLGKTFFELMSHMEKKKDSQFKSKSGKTLPKLSDLTELYNIIAEVHGKKDGSSNSSILKKIGEIKKDIEDNTIPILKVYSTGSFEKDSENALYAFSRNTDINYTNSRKDITNTNLWEIFKTKDKLQDRLCNLLLNEYKNKINNSGAVADYDVTKYVDDNISKAIDMAKRAGSAFISKKDMNFEESNTLPKLTIGSDETLINEILNKFKAEGFDDFRNTRDNKLEIVDLKNMLVFYEEKSSPFSPLKHISYIDQMKEVYEKTPALYRNTFTDEEWYNRRNSYIPVKNVKKDDN